MAKKASKKTASKKAVTAVVERKRYSKAEKQNILDTAAKENLTGADVQKRFGIAQLTFYRWRGPVRGKTKMAAKRGPGRPRSTGGGETVRDMLLGVARHYTAAAQELDKADLLKARIAKLL